MVARIPRARGAGCVRRLGKGAREHRRPRVHLDAAVSQLIVVLVPMLAGALVVLAALAVVAVAAIALAALLLDRG